MAKYQIFSPVYYKTRYIDASASSPNVIEIPDDEKPNKDWKLIDGPVAQAKKEAEPTPKLTMTEAAELTPMAPPKKTGGTFR